MKPGIKTSEFWLALAVVIGGALAAVYQDSEWARIAGIVASSLAAAGYGWSRTRVKENEPTNGALAQVAQRWARSGLELKGFEVESWTKDPVTGKLTQDDIDPNIGPNS